MVELPIDLRLRVAQHLGYSAPRQNAALAQIFDQNCKQFGSINDVLGTKGNTVFTLVERCDFAFRMCNPSDTAAFSQLQVILGDVNRNTRTLSIKDLTDQAYEYYMWCCDQLAMFMGLGVYNLQRPSTKNKLAGTIGDSYMLIAPEVPDTCVSDRLYLSRNFL